MNHVEMIISKGQSAKIDIADMAIVKKVRNWHAKKRGRVWYACSQHGGSYIQMHRFIMGHKHIGKGMWEMIEVPAGMVVDHINGDGMDNRRSNLRIVTEKENATNQHFHRTGIKTKRRSSLCSNCGGTGLE